MQIVSNLKEWEAGAGDTVDAQARHQRRELLPLESKYAGAGVCEVKRFHELEAENAKLKCRYADFALEHTAVEDVLSRKL